MPTRPTLTFICWQAPARCMWRYTMRGAIIILALILALISPGASYSQPVLPNAAGQSQAALRWSLAPFLQPQQPTTIEWYSTQLHAHAWSNHNAGQQPGSMQLHSRWAQNANLDVLWWQEHNRIFHQFNDYVISLAGASIDPTTLQVSIPLPPGTPVWAVNNYVGSLRATVTGGGLASASLSNNLLRMELQSDANQTADRFLYEARTEGGFRIGGQSFVRPLASDPLLSFDVARCDTSGDLVYGEVKLGLSWHNNGTPAAQQLVYRLVPASQPGGIVHSATAVTVTVPLTSTRVNLPLLAHASLLPDGDDNSIQGLFLALGARDQAAGCMEIGNFTFRSRVQSPADLVQKHREVAHRHATNYDVHHITSWEQFGGLRHMNPFLPESATLLPDEPDIMIQNFVPLVHSHNGLVGFNHPFGTSAGALLPANEQEALLQGLLDLMLPVQGWNVDLIEIYKNRAQVDLYHHLRLWDLLTVNGIELCANAASDQHGGAFFNIAYMVSWIEAQAPTQDSLLQGLRQCRVFFGDLSRFDGVFDLRLGSTPMGGTYPVHAGTAPLSIILDPLPANAQVKLVQYRMSPGRELSFVVNGQVIDPTQVTAVAVDEPSVLRVEVWGGDGEPIVLSNQIFIRPIQCDVNGSGQVTVSDVQSVASRLNMAVPPAPASYDLHPDGLIDTRDLVAAGACWQAVYGPVAAEPAS